ncbi:MAG: hypothetical protein M1816_006570 [Peltula sp. TS41687]|nr:MAG: hypothetical protein M1816_006570 [Peltula sp. TS41687]
MTSGLSSDEVAEDYKNSLEDLQLNSRYEISNLTIIAKESIDHALAISRVIENHIKAAPPNRKLLGLYVLDSVVKNVGTPYTLFLQRNLYQTFMNAYTLVDPPVRKKLEEMLKTWKEPVPGSLDSRPVFPIDVTRSIENALIKARTAAVQFHHQQSRNLPGRIPGPMRGTPTPPPGTPGLRYNGGPHPPPHHLQHSGYPHQQQQQVYVQRHIPNPLTSPEPAIHYPLHLPPPPTPTTSVYSPTDNYTNPAGSLEALTSDLSNLISIARGEFAANPYDQGFQQRLKALLDLQTILQNQHLPDDQVRLIRDQVTQLSLQNQPVVSAPTPTIQYSLPHVAAAVAAATTAFSSPPVQAPVPQVSSSAVQSLLPPNALAALFASVNAAQAQNAPNPPQIPVSQPYIMLSQASSSTPVPAPAPVITPAPIAATPIQTQQQPPMAGSSLLDSLRAAGILPPVPSASLSSNAPPPISPTPELSSSSLFPLPPKPTTQWETQTRRNHTMTDIPKDLQLTSAALKIPHPHLISYLYEAQPNQCRTCGRRFLGNEEGKRRKARHLDWHFKVNMRMAEAAKRGQNRSWYVDEMDWIRSRDENDEGNDGEQQSGGKNMTTTGNGGDGGTAAASASSSMVMMRGKDGKEREKQQWIPVPNDPAMANTTCPICQERFETVWHDEAQEWVWMDAVSIGGRIYHASCHAEAFKDGVGGGVGDHHVNTPSSRNMTPDSAALLLGKRKADQIDPSPQYPPATRNKIKRDSIT